MTEEYVWNLLADVTLVVHATYVLFVVAGQLLILTGWAFDWRCTRHLLFRLIHLICIGFVMLEAWLDVTCPLTALENSFRIKSGLITYERSFLSHWIERLIFYNAPEWVFTMIYTVFAGLVVLTWLVYPPKRNTE